MSTDVLTVSLRDFQHNANDYVGKSIILTRYNIPIARVEPITVGELRGEKNFEKKISEKIVEDAPPVVQLGRCRAPGCLEDAVGIGKVWDEGEEREIELCKKHLFKSLKEAL